MKKEIFYTEVAPLKRFIIFTYGVHPSGGLEDASYSYNNLDEALKDFNEEKSINKVLFDSHKGLEIDVTKHNLEH